MNDKVVAEGPMRTQVGKFTLSGDGLCVGRDSGDAVSQYKSPGHVQGRHDPGRRRHGREGAVSRPREDGGRQRSPRTSLDIPAHRCGAGSGAASCGGVRIDTLGGALPRQASRRGGKRAHSKDVPLNYRLASPFFRKTVGPRVRIPGIG